MELIAICALISRKRITSNKGLTDALSIPLL